MTRFLVCILAAILVTACTSADVLGSGWVADRVADTAEPQTRTVMVSDGVAIRYDDQGDGGPVLMFVHGWNCDRGYWDIQRAHFARTHRVVTVDLAGHGESSRERTEWTMQAFGADVAAVAEKLDLNDIVLIGHSMGGKVVVETARQLGPRVIAVVGADTFHNGGRGTPEPAATRILAEMDEDFRGFVERIVEGMFVEGSDPELLRYVQNDMASAPYRIARGARVASGGYDATPVIASLDVPLILISSDYRPTDMAHLEAATGGFEYREMKGIGHFVMLEDPDAFNRHLRAALSRISAPANR